MRKNKEKIIHNFFSLSFLQAYLARLVSKKLEIPVKNLKTDGRSCSKFRLSLGVGLHFSFVRKKVRICWKDGNSKNIFNQE